MNHRQIIDDLLEDLAPLSFAAPVTHIYNPLLYARKPYEMYLEKYAAAPREVILLGMNPGPWGMAQTGVPFGEVGAVRGWLGIEAAVGRPANPHFKRPVEGFACRRSEVSGRRLWGWAMDRFETPQHFFTRFFVANYCPLVFMEASGRNRTPNQLRAAERKSLEAACDKALQRLAALMRPRFVIGIGRFAADRAQAALAGSDLRIGVITHPSPANPKANKGWAQVIERELEDIGIDL